MNTEYKYEIRAQLKQTRDELSGLYWVMHKKLSGGYTDTAEQVADMLEAGKIAEAMSLIQQASTAVGNIPKERK